MKYDVFISYSREDYVDESKNVIPGNIVSQIKQFLTDNGYTYWFDEEGIYSGDAFVEVITEAIQDSEVFLFVSTQASNRSKWTNHEIATAKLLGKKTIPFRVDNSIYDKSILMYLAPLDYVDYANNPNIAFSKLLAALKNHFSKKQEEENRRLQEKEQEKARQEREAARAARLKEIDEKMANLQASIELCNTERADQNKKIDEARKQISYYEDAIKTIDTTLADLRASMSAFQKEKDALLGRKTAAAEKPAKKKEKGYQQYQPNTQRAEEALPQRVLSWIKQLKKKYWVHIGLLVVLIVFIGISSCDFLMNAIFRQYFALDEFLCIAWSAIASWGIIQLLQGKKNGMLTMLLNSATVYLYWYVDSEFSPYAFMGWGAFYLPFVLLLYLLHKKDTTSPLSWSKMKPCSIKRPRRLLTWMAAAYVFLAFAIPAIYSSAMGMTEYDMEEADNCTVYSLQAVCGDCWCARAIGDSYLPYGKYKYFETLEPDTEKALWWYELSGYTESIDHCKNYIEAEKNGFYMSDIYGKVGINPANRELVKIDIHKFNGDSLKSNQSYGINLIGADMSKGRLDVEGATLEESDGGISIKDIQGDSVVLRFNLIEHNGYYVGDSTVTTISERVIPVERVATTLKIYPDDNAFRIGQVYNIHVNNPIEDAEWEVYNEDINDLDIHIIESISERLAFVTKGKAQKRKGFMYTGDLCIKYNVNGTTICSARIKGQIQ